MRETPTLRIPLGVLGLILALGVYIFAVVSASPMIERLPNLLQALVYLILGTIWLLPLRRFLIWMETGKWKVPSGASDGT